MRALAVMSRTAPRLGASSRKAAMSVFTRHSCVGSSEVIIFGVTPRSDKVFAVSLMRSIERPQ